VEARAVEAGVEAGCSLPSDAVPLPLPEAGAVEAGAVEAGAVEAGVEAGGGWRGAVEAGVEAGCSLSSDAVPLPLPLPLRDAACSVRGP
jgi:hypothetical protein